MTKSNDDIWVTILIKYRIMGNSIDENSNGPVKECSFNILCIHDAMDVIGGRWKSPTTYKLLFKKSLLYLTI